MYCCFFCVWSLRHDFDRVFWILGPLFAFLLRSSLLILRNDFCCWVWHGDLLEFEKNEKKRCLGTGEEEWIGQKRSQIFVFSYNHVSAHLNYSDSSTTFFPDTIVNPQFYLDSHRIWVQVLLANLNHYNLHHLTWNFHFSSRYWVT